MRGERATAVLEEDPRARSQPRSLGFGEPSVPTPLTLTVIAPSRNEEESVPLLARAVQAALAGERYELLFVDDSDDGTPEILAELAAQSALHVRYIHRTAGPERWGGLAGAVTDGLASSRAEYVCVIDADMQHPPEKIPELLAAVRRTNADVVMACRYMPGGSSEGLAGPLRTLFSLGCKWVSKVLFPVRLWQVRDPLSGFLLVRREITTGVALCPLGFKISLELLVRCPRRRLVEVPYRFRRRAAGSSKADVRVGKLFLQHVWRLRTS
jgi:glycosyltransferase involved in cell wall biosynthesis